MEILTEVRGNCEENLLVEDEKGSTDARISDMGFHGPCNNDIRYKIWGFFYNAPGVLHFENHNTNSNIYSFDNIKNTLQQEKTMFD